jgi:D,D-heptose 1,7-bisphosphate phosphatase
MPNKAVFLDRDNTIIEDPGYLSDPQQVKLLPGAHLALISLRRAGYKLVVVTNQSGVARGYFTEEQLQAVNDELNNRLANLRAEIDAIYYCPYHPDGIVEEYARESDCRKPAPGMLLRAARDMDIDLAHSWMVGDSPRDIQAGLSAGCRTVRVRKPGDESEWAEADGHPEPDFTVRNLVDAARVIAREAERPFTPRAVPELPEAQEQPEAPHREERQEPGEPEEGIAEPEEVFSASAGGFAGLAAAGEEDMVAEPPEMDENAVDERNVGIREDYGGDDEELSTMPAAMEQSGLLNLVGPDEEMEGPSEAEQMLDDTPYFEHVETSEGSGLLNLTSPEEAEPREEAAEMERQMKASPAAENPESEPPEEVSEVEVPEGIPPATGVEIAGSQDEIDAELEEVSGGSWLSDLEQVPEPPPQAEVPSGAAEQAEAPDEQTRTEPVPVRAEEPPEAPPTPVAEPEPEKAQVVAPAARAGMPTPVAAPVPMRVGVAQRYLQSIEGSPNERFSLLVMLSGVSQVLAVGCLGLVVGRMFTAAVLEALVWAIVALVLQGLALTLAISRGSSRE